MRKAQSLNRQNLWWTSGTLVNDIDWRGDSLFSLFCAQFAFDLETRQRAVKALSIGKC